MHEKNGFGSTKMDQHPLRYVKERLRQQTGYQVQREQKIPAHTIGAGSATYDTPASFLSDASPMGPQNNSFDAIVIGAGLGGLLCMAELLQRGMRVVVVERLPHSGGHFTAKTFQGIQLSTGAVHMVPFGSRGVLAQMLRRLKIPHRFFDAELLHGSMNGRHLPPMKYCPA